jgi:hypothetical protein
MQDSSVTLAEGQAAATPSGKGRRAGYAERRFWITGLTVATALLFVAFYRLSWTFEVNSDGANIDLMAWDVLHGNWLLHGWYMSDVPYLTTELPQYALLEAIFGLHTVVTHIAAAMTYTLSVLLAVLLAKGAGNGRAALIRVLIAAGIMLAPQYNSGVFILVLSVGHIGASVPLLLILLILDRARPRWQIALVTGVLLAWATMGDSLTYVLGSIPLAVACAVRVVLQITKNRGGVRAAFRAKRYEVQLAVAAVGSIVAAEAGIKVVHALGGLTLYPVQFQFMGLHRLTEHLALTWHAVLVLFGANYYGAHGGIWVAAAFLHFVGLALAVWGFWRVALRYFGGAAITEQVMAGGIVLNLLLFATSGVARMNAHELAVILPYGAALAARSIPDRRPSAGLASRLAARPAMLRVTAVAGVAVLAGYLACLIGSTTRPPVGPGESQLGSFLAGHHLTYGVGGYWESSIVSVDTSNAVQVRALAGHWKKFLWEAKGPWYDPRSNYANFIVQEKGYDYTTVARGEAKVRQEFGQPARVYTFGSGRWLVLVYDKNLLAELHGSTY